CHELPRRCAVVCCYSRAGLTQAVSATGNACFNATIPKPVTEASVRERATPVVHQKCEIAASRSVYNPLQCWQDRQGKPLGLPVGSFVLSEGKFTALRVLLPERDEAFRKQTHRARVAGLMRLFRARQATERAGKRMLHARAAMRCRWRRDSAPLTPNHVDTSWEAVGRRSAPPDKRQYSVVPRSPSRSPTLSRSQPEPKTAAALRPPIRHPRTH